MSIVETVMKMTNEDEARNYLVINGFDPADVVSLMADWTARDTSPAPVVTPKPQLTLNPTRSFKPVDDEDDD